MRSDLFEVVANYTYDWESWFLPDGRVRWINPAVERMTGFTVEECLAMADYPLEIVHAEDRPALRNLLKSALRGTSGNDVEFRICRQDGETGWAAVSWQPMRGSNGKRLGIRTSVRDISWRKNAEEALRLAKADAERANQTKSRFLAAASHDLRQPMQAISMYVAALSSRALDAASQEILDDIRLCLVSGNELLEDLVDISRLDAGVVIPEFASVAIADLFELMEKSFQREAEERKIDLRFVLCSLFVRSDPIILGRILQNLVSNALRYTRKGRILVGCRRRGGMLILEVRDTGIGIPPDETERIFEEFYQIDNAARDGRRGVGLGLAIVRRQSALLGASVSVRSNPGKGSSFAITLPLADGRDAAPVPATRGSDLDLKGRAIAVLDDEPRQLRALQRFLSVRNAHVIPARSISEILTKLDDASPQPDLIITDYRLEAGSTGAAAISAVRSKIGRSVPAIILTGDTEPRRIAEAEASGFRLLHKPVDPEGLIETIAQMLAEH